MTTLARTHVIAPQALLACLVSFVLVTSAAAQPSATANVRMASPAAAGEMGILEALEGGGGYRIIPGRDDLPVFVHDPADLHVSESAWSPVGGGIATTFAVRAAASFGDVTCIGGRFEHVVTATSTVDAANVACWDGEGWHALGYGVDGAVNALAFDEAGHLYVGGVFMKAYGSPEGYLSGRSWGHIVVNGIARWDGKQWRALGGGVSHSVMSLGFDAAGNLFVGGHFSRAYNADGPDVVSNAVVRWNGSAWRALGGGVEGRVNAIEVVDDGVVYVGGEFHHAVDADGVKVSADNVVRWDGQAWSSLGSGVDGTVSALEAAHDGLYLGGRFGTALTAAGDSISASNLVRWSDGAWASVGSGVPGWVSELRMHDGMLVAGGSFGGEGAFPSNIAGWDGNAWRSVGSGVDGPVTLLGRAADGSLVVGGGFKSTSVEDGTSIRAGGLATWDGAWSRPAETLAGAGEVHAMSFAPGEGLYIGGRFRYVYQEDGTLVEVNNVARWDGAHWRPLDDGVQPGGTVYAFERKADGRLIVGGRFASVRDERDGRVTVRNLATWDGQSWAAFDGGIDDWGTVFALHGTDDGTALYVAGHFDSVYTASGSGLRANQIARYRDGTWDVPGEGIVGSPTSTKGRIRINDVAFRSDTLYVGGIFVEYPSTAGAPADIINIAYYDGDSFEGVGDGLWGSINALVPYEEVLLVGGSVQVRGGPAANGGWRTGILTWDGRTWSSLGHSFSSGAQVNAIERGADAVVYAGGEFEGVYDDNARLMPSRNVAMWNGEEWHSIEDGPLGRVNALAVDEDGRLFAGGALLGTPSVPSYGVASWSGRVSTKSESPAPRSKPQPAVGEPYPNPSSAGMALPYQLPSEGHVRAVMHDILGRRLFSVTDEVRPAGPHTLYVDLTALASGSYILYIEAGGYAASRLISVVR